MHRTLLAVFAIFAFTAALPAAEVRLTNDNSAGGYVSAYTLATSVAVTDPVINECSQAFGRQNEPSVAVDPRNSSVLIGSSNDYCGVYATKDDAGNPTGPIWLGYYRSEDSGASFQSSLVPGYPGDPSPYAALAHIREASAGDPVVAWDGHGRAFLGAEASGDPAGTKKTFGDVWVSTFDNPGGTGGSTVNDGKRFVGSTVVAFGSSAPNLLGKFQDKTALQADHTGSACDANVYFAVTRFSGGNGNVAIYFIRSTDHGSTWSTPMKVSASIRDVQDPEISITGNGHVYVTFHQFAFTNGQPDAINYVKSTDCGRTFSPPQQLITFIAASPTDVSDPQPVPAGARPTEARVSLNRDCGDFANHCLAGFTFPRYDVTPRSAADQTDASNEFVYVVYAATKPGSVVSTGTTYGTVAPGTGGQTAAYFLRLDGATGAVTAPALLDDQTTGHQIFPAVAADGGLLHVIWWDSR
ncbi:MAG TPA: sialidase family protein, partial [Bryobacterales bacterium]|nr:sialidase family protein [Bryobacterales bacterium]